jgi:glycosyltransferase involved in cell wall biosynthesis
LYEPFGAVVNEALLAGCNVLCSSKAGASTLINDQNGNIFDPSNVEELTKKLYNALSSIDLIKTEVFLRKNKMPFSFNEKIEQLINNL